MYRKCYRKHYGESALSRTRVFDWYKSFKEGRTTVENLPHDRRPATSVSKENKFKKVKINGACKLTCDRTRDSWRAQHIKRIYSYHFSCCFGPSVLKTNRPNESYTTSSPLWKENCELTHCNPTKIGFIWTMCGGVSGKGCNIVKFMHRQKRKNEEINANDFSNCNCVFITQKLFGSSRLYSVLFNHGTGYRCYAE